MKTKLTEAHLIFAFRIVALIGTAIATQGAFNAVSSWFFFQGTLNENEYNISRVLNIIEPFVVVIIIYKMGIWAIKSLYTAEVKKDE